jgi:hypothetical protein
LTLPWTLVTSSELIAKRRAGELIRRHARLLANTTFPSTLSTPHPTLRDPAVDWVNWVLRANRDRHEGWLSLPGVLESADGNVLDLTKVRRCVPLSFLMGTTVNARQQRTRSLPLLEVMGPAVQTTGDAPSDPTAVSRPQALTLPIYPVQPPHYKVILVLEILSSPRSPSFPHHLGASAPSPRIVPFHNAVAQRKHHHLLLATPRRCPQLPPPLPSRPFKDAIGQSPQPLRGHRAPTRHRRVHTEGATS